MKPKKRTAVLFGLRRYIIFFLAMDLIITCCMILFLNTMTRATGIVLSRAHIEQAAKLTFLNVILLSLICTLIDDIRRRVMIRRPVRQIMNAAECIQKGDFSVRIPALRGIDEMNGFGEIVTCFNQMAEELSGIETLRSDFIANVSHELKTPLAVMQNYGTMLQQPSLSETKRLEYARAIIDTSRRLASLITNILKLNKLENQQIFPDVKTYDLSEQLCACLLDLENAWEKKELNIETDIEEGVMVESDAELLALVWHNLFSNAIKFTDAHGTVSLALRTAGEYVLVSVSDTGCGISRETGSHIFEKFYQGDTSHAAQGNGLGLALVKRVMDIVGGDISVSSQVGKGSTFTVKICKAHDETS
ncbi:MAG TPA: HAMP domain-containing histidine kinase [Candidatus Merdibacter merdavium]|uniref:histidine kinase n=1 Tax=Candidatus Merdibacter merdavium TaxID=2838692 RepID=A0A9D2NP81_9FIRM|nr:HAMP domain-containing histidine kinase [Candidatus Merdibacter merdavium]